jgi:AraC-like DNA-binding protein
VLTVSAQSLTIRGVFSRQLIVQLRPRVPAPTFDDGTGCEREDAFRAELHQFIDLCQVLVLAVLDREPLYEIVSRLVAALPTVRCEADFLLLRSVLTEFVVRTIRAYGELCDDVAPLTQLTLSNDDLAGALTACMAQVGPPSPSVHDRRADRAMTLIGAWCCDPTLRPSTIARAVGVSESRLARLLRLRYSSSFRAARRRARMRLAKSRLENSVDSIKEIAAQTGYSSTSQLDRDFRMEYAIAPGAYRTRHLTSA